MLASYINGNLQDDDDDDDDDDSSDGGTSSSSSLLATLATAAGTAVNVAKAVGLIPPTATTYPAGTIYTQDPTTGKYHIATPTGSKYFKAYKEVTATAASPPSFGLGGAMPRLLGGQMKLLGPAAKAKLLGTSMPKLLGALGATGVDATTYATDTSTPTSTWIVLGAGALVAVGGIAYAMHRSKKADA